MAFRDLAHRNEVFRTPEYRSMVRKWAENDTPVPLSVFQDAYGKAFFDRNGKSERPGRTETSRKSFINLMIWTGKAPSGMTWDEWESEADTGSP